MSDPVTRLNAALEGRYRIESELGEGGMAMVYLADDLKHERKVALKVLKPELAAVVGAERFLAEIKTTANLQHPHILPLFDSGGADGFLFYVMPYVDGESLRDRINREKQLPVDEAVRIATAVAGALDYAHRHDVIHRDIKPANILIHDGQPVVADFGIALAVSAAGGGRLTETGLSLGTPHYMSPEQATADRDLSAHSDIYALACVLYEMLTGGPPFSAPTAQAVLMQILTEEAKPVTAVRKSVPEHVEGALEKALEKLPADRFTSAQAFAKALNDPGATRARRAVRAGGVPAETVTPVWRRAIWPAATAIATVAALTSIFSVEPINRAVTRFELLDGAEGAQFAAVGQALAISSDGRVVAYLKSTGTGVSRVHVRPLDMLESTPLAPGHQASSVTLSTNGRDVAYIAEGKVWRVPATGGPATELAADVSPREVAWASDRRIYFLTSSLALARISEDGGDMEVIWTPSSDDGVTYSLGSILEGGERGLVQIGSGRAGGTQYFGILDFATQALDTLGAGESAKLVDRDIIVWSRGDGTLMAQLFDDSTGELIGRSVAVMGNVGIPATEYASYDVSENGTLVYDVSTEVRSNLTAVSRGGLSIERPHSIDTNLGFRLSPDGTRITYEEGVASIPDIWVMELASGAKTRITFDATAFYPTWSHDGLRVAYYRVIDGETDLYWKNADGSGQEETLLENPMREIEVAFTPDGRRMVVRGGDQSRGDDSDLVLFEVGGDGQGTTIAAAPGDELSPMISPDGNYVAYTLVEEGRYEVFVRSLDNPAERWQVSTGGGSGPLWNQNGEELFYRTGSHLMGADISLVDGYRRLSQPRELFRTEQFVLNQNHTAYAMLPDGETFLFSREAGGGSTVVVVNWIEELRALLKD